VINIKTTAVTNIVEMSDLSKHDNMLMFGYGSLMYPSGINGRGMTKAYHNRDIRFTRLSGYRRDLSVNYNGVFYYGMEQDAYSEVVGAIFEISNSDLITLMHDERAYPAKTGNPMYALVDVTNKICDSFNLPVFSLVNDPYISKKSNRVKIQSSFHTYNYVHRVWKNIKHFDIALLTSMLRTGIIKA